MRLWRMHGRLDGEQSQRSAKGVPKSPVPGCPEYDTSCISHSAACECAALRCRFRRAQSATSSIVLSVSGRKGKIV
jgi:hypothetical protein